MTMIEPLAAENRRLRNSETSSIGWGRRRSQATNTAAAAAASAKPASGGRAGPAPFGGLDDGEHQGADGQGGQDQTDDIDRRGGRVPGGRHEEDATEERHRGHRGHGDKDAAPPEVLEQPAAR